MGRGRKRLLTLFEVSAKIEVIISLSRLQQGINESS